METNYNQNVNYGKKRSNNYIIYTFLGVLIVGFVIAFALLSKKSHYEQGNEYLNEKMYTEALSEFQKVDADEKDFRLAQSKINYIHGYTAFNDSLRDAASTYLLKVIPEDEYYPHAQMMLDKIRELENMATTETRKDTLIVKQEITQKPSTSTSAPGVTRPTDTEINRTFIRQLDVLITKFESQYQSARSGAVVSKKEYVTSMNNTMNQLIQTPYSPSQTDGNVTELRRMINQWMSKRIAFIDRLVAENSVTETNTSRSLREEGDKLYYAVVNQMKKVKTSYAI